MAAGAEYVPSKSWKEFVDSKLARLQGMAAAALAALGIAQNRVQQVSASGTVVAAAGAITPNAALTTQGPLGKVRVTANFSGVGGGGAGGVHAFLQLTVGGGPATTIYSWAPVATGGVVDGAGTSMEVDTGAPPGTVITAHWQTTAGDDAVTLGGAAGAGIDGAVLRVEELP